jgi:PadR family transcriptional regulator PadR
MSERTQFLKGCGRTLVLQLLSERPMYGYEIALELSQRSKGLLELGQGTLYPLLYSLEATGAIRVSREELVMGEGREGREGRKRRYYALTPKGRCQLESSLATWSDISRGMNLVLKGRYA